MFLQAHGRSESIGLSIASCQMLRACTGERLATGLVACQLLPFVNYGHIGALLPAFIYSWLIGEERPLHRTEDASPCLGRCSCSHRAEAQALARHRRFQSGAATAARQRTRGMQELQVQRSRRGVAAVERRRPTRFWCCNFPGHCQSN